MRRFLRLFASALPLAVTVLVPSARAQSICLPEAVGLPSLGGVQMNTGPNWWGSISEKMTRLDDPRWNGAVSQDFNGEVTFRALHRSGSTIDTLFLSWTAKIDEALNQADIFSKPPTGDQLIVGFKQSGGDTVLIHFGLNTSSVQDAYAGASTDLYTWNGSWTDAGTVPSWISTMTRTWTWANATGDKANWTFQMVVPINAAGIGTGTGPGLNLTNGKQFDMFYAFLVNMPNTTVPSSYPEYRWPSGVPVIRSTTSVPVGQLTYPNPRNADWGQVSWGTSSSCAGDIALDANQIGVSDPPDWHLKFDYPPGPNTVTNQITAKPENVSGVTLLPGTVQADFYLSNYGSQITNPQFWEKISSPTSPPRNSNDFSVIHSLGLIQFPWSVPTTPVDERCKYIQDTSVCNPAGISDQCILVQLSEVTPGTPSPTPPPPLVFRNQSVYENMLFQKASTLRHRAQISVVGLTPLDDGRTTRDVYLYVETVNMPARTTGDRKTGVTRTRDTVIVAKRDTSLNLEWGVVRLARGDSLRIPLRRVLLAAGAPSRERFATVRRAAQNGQLTVAEVDAAVPTFRIHAYHATGDSIGKSPVLEPQTSFGYWVEHDGETIGWRYKLEGEHIVKLAPHYYKIEVPNNGRAIITTVIEALPWRPFALSLHGGVSLPSGGFKTTNDRGFGITADAEYWWSRRFALQALFGYHRFGGKGTNPDLELFHASAGLEVRITTANPSLLVEGGGGTYHFKPGSSNTGTHAGASVEFDVSPQVSLGVNGRLHTVFTTGSNTTFYSVQAGGKIRL